MTLEKIEISDPRFIEKKNTNIRTNSKYHNNFIKFLN